MRTLCCTYTTVMTLVVVLTTFIPADAVIAGSPDNFAATPISDGSDNRVNTISSFTGHNHYLPLVSFKGHPSGMVTKTYADTYFLTDNIRHSSSDDPAQVMTIAQKTNKKNTLSKSQISQFFTVFCEPYYSNSTVFIGLVPTGSISSQPKVTVNGHDAEYLYFDDEASTYYYLYRLQPSDNEGPAAAIVAGTDNVGQAAFYIDRVAPKVTMVTDPGNYTSSVSELEAAWTMSDATSEVVDVKYAVGTTPGGTNVRDWTSIGNKTSFKATSLSLESSGPYYFSIKASDTAGNWSSPMTSQGTTVDTTPPTKPVVTDSGVCAESTTTLTASFSSTDTLSAIKEYWYAINTSPNSLAGDYVVPWTSAGTGTSVARGDLRLTPGHTYYIHAYAVNAAGLKSEVGVSDGIIAGSGYQKVKRDLLAGYGNFSNTTYSRWWSTYPYSKYDYSSNPYTLYYITIARVTDGYNTCSLNDTVANGWTRISDTNAHPVNNVVYQITDRPNADVTGAQSIGLKGLSKASYAVLERHLPIGSQPYNIHAGDTLEYRIDKAWMQNYTGLATAFSLQLYFDTGLTAQSTIPASTNALPASVAPTVVPSGATDVNVRVKLATSGKLGAKVPTAFVDDAHIYLKRAGSQDYEQWVIPVPRERGIKGHLVHADGDTYAIAGRYDDITVDPASYSKVHELRYLNPNARLFIYYSGATVAEATDASGKDRFIINSPIGFVATKTDHPDWLYTNGVGTDGYVSDSDYPDRYYVKITNPDYQNAWSQRIIDKLKSCGANGVWMDDMVSHAAAYNSSGQMITVEYQPYDVQQFLHAVIPSLHAQGLKVIQNASSHNIGSTTFGRNVSVYFDPFWKADTNPNGTYALAKGYQDNTADNTPDIWFQEYAFLRPFNGANLYTKNYWLACMNDMDAVQTWNTALDPNTGNPRLAADQQKSIHMTLGALDTKTDPAAGINGWLRFGLCSYLLGQNDWTFFGSLMSGNGGPDADLSITRQLGTPTAARKAFNADCYYRVYTGGVVVVNTNPSAATAYTVPFNVVDENGVTYSANGSITLPARTGRILLRS